MSNEPEKFLGPGGVTVTSVPSLSFPCLGWGRHLGGRVLTYHAQDQEFHPQSHIKQPWYAPIIPALARWQLSLATQWG